MPRTPQHLQQKSWDAVNPRYASLDHPEWMLMERLPVYFWDDKHNHKRYMKWLANELGFSKPEDWYQVTHGDFLSRRGGRLMDHYDGSYFKLLKSHYPNFDWKPWLFPCAPHGYWNDLKNCLHYVKWFEKQKNFKNIEGWYNITQDHVFELSGYGLMDHFECSVQRLLRAVYPDHDLKPWLFVQTPKRFWPKKQNRVDYMAWLEKELGYKSPEDWYKFTNTDLKKNYGGSLVQQGYKTIQLVRELYPEREWYQWMFRQVRQGYFKKKSHRVKYLKWLGAQLGYKCERDWLQIKQRDFAKHFGASLYMTEYVKNPLKAVKEIFPNCEFKAWEFYQVPNGFWDDQKNCRSYLRWLGERLGVKKKDDWYKAKRSDFRENLGSGFLKRFRSPSQGLQMAYPKHNWIPWLFENVPVGFWDDKANRKQYYSWLGKRLGFNSKEDWRKLSSTQLRANRGDSIIMKISVTGAREEAASYAKRR